MFNNIPDDKLPACWKDETRINALYAPLRSRTLNPIDWDTKFTAWSTFIALHCAHNALYTFTVPQLVKEFTRHGRAPSCLSAVVTEMLRTGQLQHLDRFLDGASLTWSGWAADLLFKRPIATVKRSLFMTATASNQDLVHPQVVRDESLKLIKSLPDNYVNRVVGFEDFLMITGRSVGGRAADVRLLLRYLETEGKASVCHLKNKSILVKVSESGKVKPITELEIGIYTLEENEKIFTSHIEKLEDEINRYLAETKSHLSKGRRQLAKNCLRKKKELEKRVVKKIETLQNIQVLLGNIQDVHLNTDVLKSYQQAVSMFSQAYKDGGLSEDAVEDTMLNLKDVLDVHEDIQSAMTQPLSDNDADLEDELAELMKSESSLPSSPVKLEADSSVDDVEEQLAKLDIKSLPTLPNVINKSGVEL